MKPFALLALALGAVFAAMLVFAVVGSAVSGLRGPSSADLARRDAELARIDRAQQLDADLYWLDRLLAGAWRVVPLVAVVGALGFVAVRGVAYARFRRVYAEPSPAGLLPVELIDQATARAALSAYHGARQLEAQRQAVPHSLNFSPHYSSRQDTPPLLEAPAAQLAAPTPTFAQLLDSGAVGKGSPLLLGYDATTGDALAGTWNDLYSTAVAGLPGSGKSTSQRFLACQTALHGARFVVCDPHAGAAEDSLAATLEPLRSVYLCEHSSEPRRILEAVKYVASIGEARVRGRDTDTFPVILWVDELTGLLGRSDIGDALAGLLEQIAQEYRKRFVYLSASGQIWTAARTSSELRDSLASVLCHRMKRSQARLLLPTEEAAQVERLETGQAVLWRTSGVTTKVKIPNCTAQDVARVALLLDSSAPSIATSTAGPGPRPLGFHVPAPARPRPGPGPDNGPDGAGAVGRVPMPIDAEAAHILAQFAAGASVHTIAAALAGTANPGDRKYKAARARVEQLLRDTLN